VYWLVSSVEALSRYFFFARVFFLSVPDANKVEVVVLDDGVSLPGTFCLSIFYLLGFVDSSGVSFLDKILAHWRSFQHERSHLIFILGLI